MTKTDKILRKFVKTLLKYAEKEGSFNSGFTTEQIPAIFKGWTELEFNIIHHGAGIGCCTYIGPDCYQVNVGHCNTLQGKFTDSNRTKWRLIIAAAAIIFTIINGLFTYLNYTYNRNQSERQSHQQPELQRDSANEIKQYK